MQEEFERIEEKYKKRIEEMQHHIDDLKNKLAEAQDNMIHLPHEPIKVAEMLIDATETYRTSSLAKMLGGRDTATYELYSNADLRQIAEHLLVYCGNYEE